VTVGRASATGPRDGMDLRWLLDRLLVQIGGIDMAVLLSADGLLLTGSAGLAMETAEHLAATGSALIGLARSTGRQFGRGAVHQAAIEMDGGYLLVTAAGQGTGLAVLTGPDVDIGLIVYEMHLLVRRVGSHMSVAGRPRGSAAAGAGP
jgi:predicted regulator of Ras-like GTPase activity (Roadblock/LC7/MglB family)